MKGFQAETNKETFLFPRCSIRHRLEGVTTQNNYLDTNYDIPLSKTKCQPSALFYSYLQCSCEKQLEFYEIFYIFGLDLFIETLRRYL